MSCAHAHDATIAGETHTVLCDLPSSHTGVHRVTTATGALISWPNADHCPATTAARGTVEQCRLGERHVSPHMTEDGAHLWVEGYDTVLTAREQGKDTGSYSWNEQLMSFRGSHLPIRLGEIINTPEKPVEHRTEETVARTYKERKRKGKKR